MAPPTNATPRMTPTAIPALAPELSPDDADLRGVVDVVVLEVLNGVVSFGFSGLDLWLVICLALTLECNSA